MDKWNIDFYQKANGEVPVIEFLNNLDKKMRAKADREIELLRDYGNQLREPHSKSIKNA